MLGYRFRKFNEVGNDQSPFDKLFKVFMELLNYTSGDVYEALQWLNEIDREHKLTNDDYTMADFINDLKSKGYIKENEATGEFSITARTEQTIRKNALEEIFGKLKMAKHGNHSTRFTGQGDELTSDLRDYSFGDSPEQVAMTESIQNAVKIAEKSSGTKINKAYISVGGIGLSGVIGSASIVIGRADLQITELDIEKAAMILLTDYRAGKLGRISLETPRAAIPLKGN